KPEGREFEQPKAAIFKKWWFWTMGVFGILFNLIGWHGFGNFLIFMALLIVLERYVLRNIIHYFQERVLPGLMSRYEKLLRWILVGRRPSWFLVGLFLLFPISLIL
ncbi:hypothetical protein ACUOH5_26445, partial [Escherichia coli]